ncbi:jg11172 [Pararge aegeria aegeria]|uniref:Jg11172 protein n=1 Tax=Pararge aegeria aegeria TaxID=348720 RepID=A0A8S4RM23_9NEOP|nr:jg11172 [Pararge aegeria aegeria]
MSAPASGTDDIRRVAGSCWRQAAQNRGFWNFLQKTNVQQWTSIGCNDDDGSFQQIRATKDFQMEGEKDYSIVLVVYYRIVEFLEVTQDGVYHVGVRLQGRSFSHQRAQLIGDRGEFLCGHPKVPAKELTVQAEFSEAGTFPK